MCVPKGTGEHRYVKFQDNGERNGSWLGVPFYFYMVEALILIVCAMAVGALANSLVDGIPHKSD